VPSVNLHHIGVSSGIEYRLTEFRSLGGNYNWIKNTYQMAAVNSVTSNKAPRPNRVSERMFWCTSNSGGDCTTENHWLWVSHRQRFLALFGPMRVLQTG
jgi:hypothetical protein